MQYDGTICRLSRKLIIQLLIVYLRIISLVLIHVLYKNVTNKKLRVIFPQEHRNEKLLKNKKVSQNNSLKEGSRQGADKGENQTRIRHK